ncbi:MAG: putative hydrogenase nickel incorporation protein HypB [Candidatus Methanofastidiosum methylothiophilum]|uniref:Putative hydrogenase nickel incorporation protein HypB n=1 Tax=Candidatus Methanofastidiosum methylothiophilum TaxID=1705564 RepID=A0A150ILK4_9EURY|nr:MAG: putative hydrogenase nickel incorporation protein HypB [Candidatus Methanofastidiosum methylthiophilus]KYC48065.1 MAG: putative hydrogenase nickel incorporation protein HypB [Candidatus Methanofastidiosum methylthiophilus]KYC50456.1 MAG: putative hydrogenase nickel incorporation protein HypB [Candidatus Methanofastidiosum methylthiophilus]
MHKTTDITIEKDILKENSIIAKENKDLLKKYQIKSYNVMGAIGSGKTSLIEIAIDALVKKGKKVGVIAGDVVAEYDSNRFRKHNCLVIPLNTGKECHLDAHLISHELEDLEEHGILQDLDYLFMENVGNLICPSDFTLGEDKRIVIVSVSEGDDIVLKHPIIFRFSDICIINKIDIAEAVDASPEKMERDCLSLNPKIKTIKTSVKKNIRIDEWLKLFD